MYEGMGETDVEVEAVGAVFEDLRSTFAGDSVEPLQWRCG
jgi:hypothetical protein